MAAAGPRIEPGLDAAWIAGAVERAPVPHAFAAWDVLHAPDRCRFVTYRTPGGARSYLLIWLGRPDRPIVHWVGEEPGDLALVEEIPSNAVVVAAPERAAKEIGARLLVDGAEPILGMLGPSSSPSGARAPSRAVRRLARADGEAVREFTRTNPDRLTEQYESLDLDLEPSWGAFEDGRLAGVARATVRLPNVWMISGVFVEAPSRGRGLGGELTEAISTEARAHGARPALFVRERNEVARRLYERLGFRAVDRRIWIDLHPSALPAPEPGAAR